MLSLSVRSTGASAELAEVSLLAPDGTELLVNRAFSSSLAHWFPIAQSYYLPWHIDNLYVELLVERGILGLALFVSLFACALWTLIPQPNQRGEIAPFVAASLVGVMLLGGVSSVMDVPRVALLLLLLMMVSLNLSNAGIRRSLAPQSRSRSNHQ
jgi:O-antigen ligase